MRFFFPFSPSSSMIWAKFSMMSVEESEVALEHVAERSGGECLRRQHLVLDDVGGLDKRLDRADLRLDAELCEADDVVLTGEQTDEAVLVGEVEGGVPRDALLEEPQAPCVEGPDEHRGELVEVAGGRELLDLAEDAGLEALRCEPREGEGDDGSRRNTLGEERGHPHGDGLRLARASAGDDLEVSLAVRDDALLLGGIDGWLRSRDTTFSGRGIQVTASRSSCLRGSHSSPRRARLQRDPREGNGQLRRRSWWFRQSAGATSTTVSPRMWSSA